MHVCTHREHAELYIETMRKVESLSVEARVAEVQKQIDGLVSENQRLADGHDRQPLL